MPPALLASAFRPFFLLATLYAPILSLAWLGAWLGGWPPPLAELPLRHWHGHEMLFGFTAAIICAILLTALPGWAGTAEFEGWPLLFPVGLWLLARIAFWGGLPLPAMVLALVNSLLFPVLLLMLLPRLLRVRNRLYWLLIPILLAFATCEALFQWALLARDEALRSAALKAFVHAVIVLFVLVGGLLTPVFTGNSLRERRRGDQAAFLPLLEVLALLSVLLFAACDLAAAPAAITIAVALACAVIHGLRVLRWRGWRTWDIPLVLAMHLGFAWLILAFLLKAAAAAGWVAELAWVHAFTVGALGMMMLGLMTRVVLRHTGRPLQDPALMRLAYGAMFLAATLRLLASEAGSSPALMAIAAVLWGLTFLLFFVRFAGMLVRPSLPYADPARPGES